MTMHDDKLSDLQHIVPAVTPAWLRIIDLWSTNNDDGSIDKGWSDGVFTVLAYASVKGAFGYYLADISDDGPIWIKRPASGPASEYRCIYELYVGKEPIRGVQPKGLHESFTYDPQDFRSFECVIHPITD